LKRSLCARFSTGALSTLPAARCVSKFVEGIGAHSTPRQIVVHKVTADGFKTGRKKNPKKQDSQKKDTKSKKERAEAQAVPNRKKEHAEAQAFARKGGVKQRGTTKKSVGNTVQVAKAVESVEGTTKVEGVVEKMGEVGKVDRTFIPNISKKAPELLSGQLTEKQFLKCAEKYLGEGYTEVSEGRFLSKDGLRQVIYNLHEVRSFVHHAHFEIYNTAGGQVIENARVLINP
jgi:hypothetical protein